MDRSRKPVVLVKNVETEINVSRVCGRATDWFATHAQVTWPELCACAAGKRSF